MSPNPLVGCVVVRDGRILSRVPQAVRSSPCGTDRPRFLDSAAGSTLYVNLEPCAHYGKTPPCAPSIVEKGVSRVVLGTVDPDVRVQGRGMEILRAGGVRVDAGVLEKECRWINRGFIRRITLKRPWVTLKAAVGLDGGMALRSGESKWITGYEARTVAHLLRAEHDAVLVGSGTVFRDDPELTVRNSPGRNPLKVVLDSRCSIPPGSRVLEGCLLFVGPDAHEGRCSEARSRGAEVVTAPYEGNTLSLRHVLTVLAERGLVLLVEGGPRCYHLLRHNLADAWPFRVAEDHGDEHPLRDTPFPPWTKDQDRGLFRTGSRRRLSGEFRHVHRTCRGRGRYRRVQHGREDLWSLSIGSGRGGRNGADSLRLGACLTVTSSEGRCVVVS